MGPWGTALCLAPQIVPQLLSRVAKNPAVNTVFVGLALNFAFGPKFMPEFILGFLDVAGAGFTGCALAALGLSTAGKERVFTGKGLTWPFLLATLKALVLPFITHSVGRLFTHDRALLNFLFVYGAIPAAPPVFTFAAEYGVCPNTIAGSLVICLFMSALVMVAGTLRLETRNELLTEVWDTVRCAPCGPCCPPNPGVVVGVHVRIETNGAFAVVSCCGNGCIGRTWLSGSGGHWGTRSSTA